MERIVHSGSSTFASITAACCRMRTPRGTSSSESRSRRNEGRKWFEASHLSSTPQVGAEAARDCGDLRAVSAWCPASEGHARCELDSSAGRRKLHLLLQSLAFIHVTLRKCKQTLVFNRLPQFCRRLSELIQPVVVLDSFQDLQGRD